MGRIKNYRPELSDRIEKARQSYNLDRNIPDRSFFLTTNAIDLGVFTQRLITYLQASQYKLLKEIRS